jgi:hypothetical protein
VRRAKAVLLSGCESRPATFAPAGSNWSNRGGNEAAVRFDERDVETEGKAEPAVTAPHLDSTLTGTKRVLEICQSLGRQGI